MKERFGPLPTIGEASRASSSLRETPLIGAKNDDQSHLSWATRATRVRLALSDDQALLACERAIAQLTEENDPGFGRCEECGNLDMNPLPTCGTCGDGSVLRETPDLSIDGPAGRWICRTCGFQLTKAILRAHDMAVGVDARPVYDVCPNDGSSMRPITWKEDAEDANCVGLEQMKRADAAESQLTAIDAALAQLVEEWEQKSTEPTRADASLVSLQRCARQVKALLVWGTPQEEQIHTKEQP